VRAQVNCLNAVLSATRCSRLSTEMLATLQSDWMSCVQRDSGLFSWSRTLSRERSVGARRRACTTHRRRFWRHSADSGGTTVSRRTRSRVTCSSGVLAILYAVGGGSVHLRDVQRQCLRLAILRR